MLPSAPRPSSCAMHRARPPRRVSESRHRGIAAMSVVVHKMLLPAISQFPQFPPSPMPFLLLLPPAVPPSHTTSPRSPTGRVLLLLLLFSAFAVSFSLSTHIFSFYIPSCFSHTRP